MAGGPGGRRCSVRPDNSDLRYLLYIVILDPSGERQAIKPPIFTSCGLLTASQMGSLAREASLPSYIVHTHTHTPRTLRQMSIKQLTLGQASPRDRSSKLLLLCSSVTKSCSTLCDPMDCSCQASLSSSVSQSLPKFMFIESVMLSNFSSSATLSSFCLQSSQHQGLLVGIF